MFGLWFLFPSFLALLFSICSLVSWMNITRSFGAHLKYMLASFRYLLVCDIFFSCKFSSLSSPTSSSMITSFRVAMIESSIYVWSIYFDFECGFKFACCICKLSSYCKLIIDRKIIRLKITQNQINATQNTHTQSKKIGNVNKQSKRSVIWGCSNLSAGQCLCLCLCVCLLKLSDWNSIYICICASDWFA